MSEVHKKSTKLNVYGLWLLHGGEPEGLWVKRDSWGNMMARVLEVEPMTGSAPYFNNPKVSASFHLLDGSWVNNGPLSCPGTYAYKRVGVSGACP